MREVWEFQINGIRSGGDTFTNYYDATQRLMRAFDQLHFDTEGEERDYNGEKASAAYSTILRIRRERPLVNVTVKGLRNSKPWVLQVNRLPWGSEPSGNGNQYL